MSIEKVEGQDHARGNVVDDSMLISSDNGTEKKAMQPEALDVEGGHCQDGEAEEIIELPQPPMPSLRDESSDLPRTERHAPTVLPNCRITGIDYQASLANILEKFASDEIVDIRLQQGADQLRFHWDAEEKEISCHPEQAGEFDVELCVDVVRHKHESHVFPLKLTVIADPKTLWKNIPSDQSCVYPKPDSDKVFLPCSDSLSIVAASQRGRSHAQAGRPRDDDFIAEYIVEHECAMLTDADGAGSAKFSREGSRIATRTVLEHVRASCTDAFWKEMQLAIAKWTAEKNDQAERNIKSALYKVLVQAAWEAKTAIKKEASAHEVRYRAGYKRDDKFSARDYATTLITTIAKRFECGGWLVATFWVGDGAVGIYDAKAGRVIVQGMPDGGEYGGQTRFLTEDSTEVWPQDANKLIERRLRFDVVPSFDGIILMTDGVSDPKFETDNNLFNPEKWTELWNELTEEIPFENRDMTVADALLKWMDFWSPGNHDDRTMMILY